MNNPSLNDLGQDQRSSYAIPFVNLGLDEHKHPIPLACLNSYREEMEEVLTYSQAPE